MTTLNEERGFPRVEEWTSVFLDLCHDLQRRGFVSGSGGNVSFRFGDRLLITPSGRNLGAIRERDLIFLSRDGSWEGEGRPSKEWRMHLGCYCRDDVSVVIHVHSPYAVALSCLDLPDADCAMAVYTPGYAIQVGSLPLLPYMVPGSEELADRVASVIGGRNSVLLANHGMLAVGSSPERALNVVEEIEENARLHFILDGRGRSLGGEERKALSLLYR